MSNRHSIQQSLTIAICILHALISCAPSSDSSMSSTNPIY